MSTPHIPQKLSVSGQGLDFNQFAQELGQAEYSLGLLQGSQQQLQNPDLLVSPLTAKEATTSSKIEGTQSEVSDVFAHEAGGRSRHHADVQQVINYRKAIRAATQQLQKGQKLTLHLLRSLHKVLLEGVPHQGALGKFREDTVWIGERASDPIEKALYVPPPPSQVPPLMENLEHYIHGGKEEVLIRSGLAHYQFEAIHPFHDGNGRIGRLMIPLILLEKESLSSPILYMSGYFEANRDAYIDALHAVDEGGSYEQWLQFYLKAIAEQLKETQRMVDAIYSLYGHMRSKYGDARSPYMIPFIEFIFANPIFSIEQAQEGIGSTSRHTARNLIAELERAGRIAELGDRRKNKLFVFKNLLDILE